MAETLPPVIAEFDGDAEDLLATIDEIEERFEALNDMVADPTVDIDAALFDAKYDTIEQSLSDLDVEHADPSVGLSISDFEEKYAEIEGELAALDAEQITIDAGPAAASVDDLTASIAAADAAADTLEASLASLAPVVEGTAAEIDDLAGSADNAALSLVGMGAAADEAASAGGVADLGLGADEVAASLDELGASADAVDSVLPGLASQFMNVELGVHDLDDALTVMEQSFDAFMRDTISADEALETIEATGIDVEQMLEDIGLGIQDFGLAFADAEGAIEDTEQAILDLEDALQDAEGAISDAESAIQALTSAGSGASRVISAIAGGLDSLGNGIGSFVSDIGTSEVLIGGLVALLVTAIPVVGALVGELGALSAIGFTAFAGLGALAVAAVPVFIEVAKAYEQISTDVQNVATATTAATRDTAVATLYNYLGSLNPLVANLTEDVIKAKDAFESWDQQFDPMIIELFNNAVSLMVPILDAITPIVYAAGGAVSTLIEQFQTDLSSTSFQTFIEWIAANVGPSLTTIVDFAEDVGRALAHMGEAGQPFINMLERGIGQFGRDLDHFSTSNTFKDFVNWLVANGPTIGGDLETIGEDFGKIFVSLTPSGLALLTEFAHAMNALKDVFGAVGDAIDHMLRWFDDIPQPLKNIAGGMTSLGQVVSVFSTNWSQKWATVKSAFELAWMYIGPTAAQIGNDLNQWIVVDGIDRVERAWDVAWSGIKSGFDTTWGAIKSTFATVASTISSTVELPIYAAANVWDSAWGAMKSAAKGVWDTLKTIFDDIVHGIDDVVTAAGKLSGIFSTISSIGSDLGKLATGGFHLGPIPLAEGGVVTRPTLAIVGESGPEMVLPESKVPGGFGAGSVSALPAIATVGGASDGGGGQSFGDIHITVNGAQSPQATAKEIQNQLLTLQRSMGSKRGVVAQSGNRR